MLQEKLELYCRNTNGDIENYELGLEYYKIRQYAAAISYFLRAAERSDDTTLVYDTLILLALCFDKLGRRAYSFEGLLQYAIAIDPTRQEAYFHMCRLNEYKNQWREMMINSSIGSKLEEMKPNTLLEYKGYVAFEFYQAFSKYNNGNIEKAKEQFLDIAYISDSDGEYGSISKNNITNLGYPDIISYRKQKHLELFKFPFDGIEIIEKNHSKHFQDMFVLALLNGKKNGYYVEFGSGLPYEASNTALLETKFDWKGLSFDRSTQMCERFARERTNPVLNIDVTTEDIKTIFEKNMTPDWIDYLQIDCDDDSIKVLSKIPFDDYQFGIIHYEHDKYRLGDTPKQASKRFLESKDYILVANNIAVDETNAYEDWWVHRSLLRADMISLNETNFILSYMLDLK
jgi:tetratricopeptide (TPR) repeat protein